MKKVLPLLTLSAGFALVMIPVRGVENQKVTANSKVEVIFDHPEKFSDVKDSFTDSERGREAILSELRDFIVAQAAAVLPKGQTLTITFTDIDLAGDYEPWRISTKDVRIVKDIYPPRLDFSYKVTDESGAVVKEGTEKLRDLGFMSRMVINRSDGLSYEKSMLQDWIRSNLRPGKK